MISIRLRAQGLGGLTGTEWKTALEKFQDRAGELLIAEIRDRLGRDTTYPLDPAYAARKPKLKRFRRMEGKDADQPLILSQAWYQGLVATKEGDTVTVTVEEGEALSPKGFDYPSLWEERLALYQRALEAVETKLDELLLDCVFEEMRL